MINRPQPVKQPSKNWSNTSCLCNPIDLSWWTIIWVTGTLLRWFPVISFQGLFFARTKSYFAPWLDKRKSLLNKFLVRSETTSWNMERNDRIPLRCQCHKINWQHVKLSDVNVFRRTCSWNPTRLTLYAQIPVGQRGRGSFLAIIVSLTNFLLSA